jgi:hypothetical protein
MSKKNQPPNIKLTLVSRDTLFVAQRPEGSSMETMMETFLCALRAHGWFPPDLEDLNVRGMSRQRAALQSCIQDLRGDVQGSRVRVATILETIAQDLK